MIEYLRKEYRVVTIRKRSENIRFYPRCREKSSSFVSGQEISISPFKVSAKSRNFIIKLPQIILLDVFV